MQRHCNLRLREMKTLDVFCASQAATAICTSLEQRVKRPEAAIRSMSSQQNLKSISSKLNHGDESYERSSSDQVIETKRSASLVDSIRKSSCIRPSAYFTPGSQRYLLAENYKSCRLVLMETKNATDPKSGGNPDRGLILKNETPLIVPVSDKCNSPILSNSGQVVVVWVSLHCKGCAGKVKKHISKIQGVTSFSVNFDARKVTVSGDVTPSQVLASISKVRTTQVLLPLENPNDLNQVVGELIKT